MADDPHRDLLRLWKKQNKATADLHAAEALAVAAPPSPPVQRRKLKVPAGSSVVVSFAAKHLECIVGLNQQILGKTPNTPFHLALRPQGNLLVALLFATSSTWAFEIDLTIDGKPLDTVRDQDDGNGSKPVSPILWMISVVAATGE